MISPSSGTTTAREIFTHHSKFSDSWIASADDSLLGNEFRTGRNLEETVGLG